jgi:hypothetical protein
MSQVAHGFSSEINPYLQLSTYSSRAFYQHLGTITSLADLAMAIESIYDLAFSNKLIVPNLIPYVETLNFNTKYRVLIGDDLLSIELTASNEGNKATFYMREMVENEYKVIDSLELTGIIGRGHIKLINALHVIADWHLRPKKV